MGGHHKVVEKVPSQFVRRIGDWFKEGANNTLIILGTDRAKPDGPASVDDGLGHIDAEEKGKGTGTITIVAGRKDNDGGELDLSQDDSLIYLSMKTEADKNLGLEEIPVDVNAVEHTGPSAIMKSDAVRIVYRKEIKISVEDGSNYIYMDGDYMNISLNDKVKVLLDSTDEGDAKIWIGENLIDVAGSGEITVTAEDTTVKAKSGGEIKVGQLSAALEELIGIITGTGAIISQTGNLGAPVPMNPQLITELNQWTQKWIAGENFIKMDG